MSREEMLCDLQTFFPSWYWDVVRRSSRSLLDTPSALQKRLWRVFMTAWLVPLQLRAKWLWWKS